MAANMPPAEVEIDSGLLRSLLEEQRPDLAGRPILPLAFGWDNVSFRVGDDLVARLPRRVMAAQLTDHEVRWLPSIASELPLPIPVPLFTGVPGGGYPWHWTLVPWIAGESAATAAGLDLEDCARALARFLRALHQPAPEGAPPNPFRGVPLRNRDEATRERFEQLENIIDVSAARALWEQALAAPEYEGEPIWIHGDLHPHNMLAVDGHISGVIDFGDVTAGDPATDLSVGWIMFPAEERRVFMDTYGHHDDAMWQRARGWALSLATAYIAHGADNPTMSSIGDHAMGRVLSGE